MGDLVFLALIVFFFWIGLWPVSILLILMYLVGLGDSMQR